MTNTTNTSATNVVTHSDDFLGGLYIVENHTGDDGDGDAGDALDIINDLFQYEGTFRVHCPNLDILKVRTLSSVFHDFACGVPYDGDLILDAQNPDGIFGYSDPLNGTYGNLHFVHPNVINAGSCVNKENFTDNVDSTSTVIEL